MEEIHVTASATDKNNGGPVKPCIEVVRLSGKKFPYMEKESPSMGNLQRSQGGLPPNAALKLVNLRYGRQNINIMQKFSRRITFR